MVQTSHTNGGKALFTTISRCLSVGYGRPCMFVLASGFWRGRPSDGLNRTCSGASEELRVNGALFLEICYMICAAIASRANSWSGTSFYLLDRIQGGELQFVQYM